MSLKVAVSLPDLTFTRAGGLRTQFERTTEELEKLGCEITYFTGANFEELRSVDLCHIFSMNSPTYFKGIALKKLNKPLVYSSVMWRESKPVFIRTLLNLSDALPFKIFNDVVACRDLSRLSDVILPNTNQEKEWLRKAIGVDPKKMLVVPNGADNRFKNSNLDEVDLNLPFDDFVFSSCVVYQRKNLVRLADACLENGFPLVIAGPIEDEGIFDLIQKKAERGLSVKFLGGLANDDVMLGALYKRCRVFALPSFYETPGISALEAGLQGGNIVVTKVGGAEQYFGEYARYVDPYDKRDISDKLADAWHNPLSQRQKEELASHIADKYSWLAVAQHTKQVYEEVVNGKI
ncbi:glycosyltransferase family 4 protein [Pseudidiomarina halophila]|uniref:Glycosyl transferase family 1 domain-containing protein n=1 Tax=Pseudidiomarina halophila TaxID=1449799 RepID=A0A432XYZ7_9GAMM|nr:glycosyltransferase family 4 protein [Pseudidiomarina halophila]RUO53917.1 hypothetical protein CWI69_00295 [Pseudidiomarina halophila]